MRRFLRVFTSLVFFVCDTVTVESLSINTAKAAPSSAASLAFARNNEVSQNDEPGTTDLASRYIVHWKGEFNEGYSTQFRHVEFEGALSAIVEEPITLQFRNALEYNHDSVELVESKKRLFEESMQFVDWEDSEQIRRTTERCSLVHACYQIAAEGETYEELCDMAITNGFFRDYYKGGERQNETWCFRVRQYGDEVTDEKAKRYGHRARSMKLERRALQTLEPLFLQFGGSVDLDNPDYKIYVFDGLIGGKKVLAKRIAQGPQTSVIAPNTRICVTNTPLCPIAAFSLCNIAGVRPGMSILDPYAGSCATLLAASMISPDISSVAIEIAHDGLVNRHDIKKDFATRGLTPPLALLHGDSTHDQTRHEARAHIGGDAFDIVIADPPYGIRESTNYNELPPLTNLLHSIATDRRKGERLLKVGGRLAAFVPCTEEERIEECLPTEDELDRAGLKLYALKEQPLNDRLSRWLAAYECVA